MRNVKWLASALLLLMAGYAYAADKMPDGVQTRKADSGMDVSADAKGMTLYTFAKDADGKSNCNARCAMAWPPLAASGRREIDGRLDDRDPR